MLWALTNACSILNKDSDQRTVIRWVFKYRNMVPGLLRFLDTNFSIIMSGVESRFVVIPGIHPQMFGPLSDRCCGLSDWIYIISVDHPLCYSPYPKRNDGYETWIPLLTSLPGRPILMDNVNADLMHWVTNSCSSETSTDALLLRSIQSNLLL